MAGAPTHKMSDITCIHRLKLPSMQPTMYSEEYDREYLHYRERVDAYFTQFDEYFKGYDASGFRKGLEDMLNADFEKTITNAAVAALEYMKGDIAAIKKQMMQCVISYANVYTNIVIDTVKIGHMWDDLAELKNRSLLDPGFTKYIHRARLLASDELDSLSKNLQEAVGTVCKHNRDLYEKLRVIISADVDIRATDSILMAEKLMTLEAADDGVKCMAVDQATMEKLRQALAVTAAAAAAAGRKIEPAAAAQG